MYTKKCSVGFKIGIQIKTPSSTDNCRHLSGQLCKDSETVKISYLEENVIIRRYQIRFNMDNMGNQKTTFFIEEFLLYSFNLSR